MLFNSFDFIIFLPIVFIIYWILPHKIRWILLLASSYYFYMSWNVKYILLIFFTTVISYVAARLLDKEENKKKRKWILGSTTILCLGVLLFFKYFNFLSKSISDFISLFAININPVTLNLLLPVGISFYTFQTLSYVIDVYKGDVSAEHHFGYYATFISFFPQLVAGPIERTSNLLPQIKENHKFDYSQVTYGLKLMAWGFFKKLCVADEIAVYIDVVYSSLDSSTGFDLLIAVLGFTMQIYCDFSGYSDIAIGTSKLMGVNLMANFRSPYFSVSIKEFWSRWHISLSTWFKDYVYIPLGGNRCGLFRHSFNLLITFLVSGLWHGANWTFVAWGGIHGIAQVFENLFEFFLKPFRKKVVGKFISLFVVFVFCNLAWVFFRAESFSDAIYVITHIFSGINEGERGYFSNSIELDAVHYVKINFTLIILFIFDFFSLKIDVIKWIGNRNVILRWGIYIIFVMILFIFAHIGNSSFIYFQF